MSSIQIREACQADLPGILELWVEFMKFHSDLDPHFTLAPNAKEISKSHLQNLLVSDQDTIIVAAQDNKILAYGIACIREKSAVFAARSYGHISDLAVTESFRGQGMGKKVADALLQWFQSRKIRRIEIRTILANDLSNSFWEDKGFKTFAQEKVFIPD